MMGTRWRRAAVLGAMLSASVTASAGAQVGRLGTIGDSLTDEYFEETYSYAKNWTVQLVEFRGVNMGPTAQGAGQPGNTWGEPRRTGFESNFARYGADSTSAAADGQVTGLAANVGAAGVTHAVVAIGANDFSPSTSTYFSIYWGLWSQSQINSYVNARIGNIEAILDVLEPTGVEIVLCTYPDFGVVPAGRQVYGNATRRDRVTAAVMAVNAGLDAVARRRRLMLVDLGGLATSIIGTNTSLRQFLSIGNVNIQLFNRDTSAHANPLAGFVDDGAHPHTTLQGIFANLMMSAMNDGWNAGHVLFSDQEILAHGGIAYGGSDTLTGQIGPYTAYFRNYICPANFNGTGGVTVQDLFDYLAAWFASSAAADYNLSGAVTVQDLFDFLNGWFARCQ